MTTECRRCSECLGEQHHWVDGGPPEVCPHGRPDSQDCPLCWDEAPGLACKHCPATADSCHCEDNEGCAACDGAGVIVRGTGDV